MHFNNTTRGMLLALLLDLPLVFGIKSSQKNVFQADLLSCYDYTPSAGSCLLRGIDENHSVIPLGDLPDCHVVAEGSFHEAVDCDSGANFSEDLTFVRNATGGFAWKPIDCSTHCCSMADIVNGSFSNPHTGLGDDWPLENIWTTHSGCMPFSLRPLQAIPCMHAYGVRRIIFIGGSVLRQMMGRFVSMARKSKTTVDHSTRGETRYRIWSDHDLLEIGSEDLTKEQRLQWVSDLLHPDNRNRVSLAAEATSYENRLTTESMEEPLLDVLFLWSDNLDQQLNHWKILNLMSQKHESSFVTTNIITGVWEHYRGPGLDLLEDHKAGLDRLLSVIAVPLERVFKTYIVNQHAGTLDADHEHVPRIKKFNQYLDSWSKWVNGGRENPRVIIMDYDALSNAHPLKAPSAHPPSSGDNHDACEFVAEPSISNGTSIKANMHGSCTDAMNTVAIQLILNHACNPSITP